MDPIYIGRTKEECSKLGLTILPNFITTEEEADILTKIQGGEPQETVGRNCIQRFGSNQPYQKNVVSAVIPEYLGAVSEKIVKSGLLSQVPNSVTINEYLPGQGITAHIDSRSSGDVITILSLLSHAVVDFQLKKKEFSVLFPARALLQMRGEVRHKWTHAIKPDDADVLPELIRMRRLSIVFRHSD